jgi:hypothetical protein
MITHFARAWRSVAVKINFRTSCKPLTKVIVAHSCRVADEAESRHYVSRHQALDRESMYSSDDVNEKLRRQNTISLNNQRYVDFMKAVPTITY